MSILIPQTNLWYFQSLREDQIPSINVRCNQHTVFDIRFHNILIYNECIALSIFSRSLSDYMHWVW